MRLDAAPIVAIATASGRGGIGIVRVSGKNLAPFFQELGLSLIPRQATYLSFKQADGSIIDQGIALFFNAPHSYTGEDVLELQGHGGPIVLTVLLNRCLEAGRGIDLRLAEPGEFTQRAFLNNKLDLAQAEAIADLIEASTEAAAKSAVQSLSGQFSKAIHALVAQIIQLRMLVEATLDFPEEEIEFLEKSNARGQLSHIHASLEHVFSQAAQGALLRSGLNIVLAGQPNVGKSSLLNALSGSDIAIVTPIAGTTRDKITQAIQIEGIPLNIIDTAGLRDTSDEIERIGIERTWIEIEKADVIVHLLDANYGPSRADEQIAQRFPKHIPMLRVWNKIDLSGHAPCVERHTDATHIYLSVAQYTGMDILRTELLKIAGWQPNNESPYLARERHLTALRIARYHLEHAAEHAEHSDQQLDLFAEELRLAQEQLSSITGAFTPDDLLGTIFSQFCIGK